MESDQYNLISAEYSELASVDPSKQFVQYPEALRLLGNLEGKIVLDVGCGSGTFSRMIARRGAKVVGYDISEEQIGLAKQEEKKNPLGIKYHVTSPSEIEKVLGKTRFDLAVATLVLLYAKDNRELKIFFDSTFRLLKDGGKFVSATFNPDYKKLGISVYNRIFSEENGRMKVDFLNEQERIKCSAYFTKFSKEDYEESSKKAGFSLDWINLEVAQEGRKKLGEGFWKGYEQDCPYVGFVCKKI